MDKSCRWITNHESETKQFARRLASHLPPGTVLAIEGELGAGKTTFAQGLAQGLGVNQPVDSPTFTLLKEYQGRVPLYHLDAYRLSGMETGLGIEEALDSDGICLIEWPSHIQDWLPEDTVWLEILVRMDGRREIQMWADLLCREMQKG